MVNRHELVSRIKDFLRFSRQELTGLIPAILITGFIFSFADWGGEQFDPTLGITHLFLAIVLVAVTFFFRASCQKAYGLAEGYKAELKVWWMGLGIALAVCFVSQGKLPLVLLGAMSVSFMVKQRLGEFRYGFSYWNNGMIAYWGILGNLILAILFSIGVYFYPGNYFFMKGVWLNFIMAVCSLLPLPSLDGMAIFFASRKFYILAMIVVALAAVLLLTQTAVGLVIAVVVGLLYAVVYLLIGSEK